MLILRTMEVSKSGLPRATSYSTYTTVGLGGRTGGRERPLSAGRGAIDTTREHKSR